MILKINFYKVHFKYNHIDRKYNSIITTIHPKDLLQYDLKGSYIDNFQLKTKIDMCYGDSQNVTIKAALKTQLSRDFNNDFNNDFSSFFVSDFNNDFNNDFGGFQYSPYLSFYNNTFTVYGFDTEYDVYLVTNNNTDFNSDFNNDFSFSPTTYANFNHIRKPFTNEVWMYDATSSNAKITWKVGEDTFKTRNIQYCYEKEFDVTMTKEKARNRAVKSLCGCGDMVVPTIQETDTITKTVPTNDKYLGYPMTTFVDSNINLDSFVYTLNTTNTHYAQIDYDLARPLIDDVVSYPITVDKISKELYNHAGYLFADHQEEVRDFNVYKDKGWTFNIPNLGDYLIKTTITTEQCGVIREYVNINKIKAVDFIDFKQQECDMLVTSYAFEPLDLVFYKLKEVKSKFMFEKIQTENIPILDKKLFKFDDGVYKVEVKRGAETKTYVFVSVCNIKQCIKSITDELLCVDLCNKKPHDFTLFNIITTLSQTLMVKIETYLEYKLFDEKYTSDYYSMQTLIDKINLYCYSCNGLKIGKCNC